MEISRTKLFYLGLGIFMISLVLFYVGYQIGLVENLQQTLNRWCDENYETCDSYCKTRELALWEMQKQLEMDLNVAPQEMDLNVAPQ